MNLWCVHPILYSCLVWISHQFFVGQYMERPPVWQQQGEALRCCTCYLILISCHFDYYSFIGLFSHFQPVLFQNVTELLLRLFQLTRNMLHSFISSSLWCSCLSFGLGSMLCEFFFPSCLSMCKITSWSHESWCPTACISSSWKGFSASLALNLFPCSFFPVMVLPGNFQCIAVPFNKVDSRKGDWMWLPWDCIICEWWNKRFYESFSVFLYPANAYLLQCGTSEERFSAI